MAIQQLENARRDLLDLSSKNRLINTPRSSSKSTRLEIVDELSDQVFKMLVVDGKSMSFLANSKEAPEALADGENNSEFDEIDFDSISFAQPDEDLKEGEVPERHRDDKLQTTLTSEKLQKKLLKLFYDARTCEEEQGVNTLYLALGFLKWYEDDKSKVERQSPLILVPVQLERKSVGTRFRVSWDEGEVNTNLSLQAKLQHSFGIQLPDIEDSEELCPSEYFELVQKAVRVKTNWEVIPNAMVMWFFSFAKFLMYKDMDPERWPEGKKISSHSIVSSLVGTGFANEPPICGENELIDDILDPLSMVHVVPADSSQSIAIEEARQGRNLVIQGPPGTGKSQTITNIIATAVENGKKVLFVSEKMAALQVVKERLNEIHLGSICLELHSNKSNKRAVLQEIEKTLSLGKPKTDGVEVNAEELRAIRNRLNDHVREIHKPLGDSNVSAFQALGELVRLKTLNVGHAKFQLENPEKWTQQQYRENVATLKDCLIHLEQVGNPSENGWFGTMVGTMLPSDIERLQSEIDNVRETISSLVDMASQIRAKFGQPKADTFVDLADAGNLARFANKIPRDVDMKCINASVWEKVAPIKEIVAVGRVLKTAKVELESVVADSAWDIDLATPRRHLKAYGRSWFRFFNAKFRDAKAELSGVLQGELPSQLDAQLALTDQIIAAKKLKAKFSEFGQTGKEAYGDEWKGEDSDWDRLESILQWQEDCRKHPLPQGFFVSVQSIKHSELLKPLKVIRQNLNTALTNAKDLTKKVKLDLKVVFNSTDLKIVSLSSFLDRLNTWHANVDGLSNWTAFTSRLKRLPSLGMRDVAKMIYQGEVRNEELLGQFEQTYFETLLRVAYKRYPQLAHFSGASHETALSKFRKLDEERYNLARQQVAAAHYESFPHTAAEIGEVGILKREIKKKRRHMPIRKLLASAGHAVQAIKPVFMMSPISIAQFLEPGVLNFDILLIDEASQVKPVDAFGAIARAKQIVVVGDERQLPPTGFFDNVVSDENEDDDPARVSTSDIESILGLCSAQSMNERMLRWHYRSRHHSLIAVSNFEFYDSRLYVVPSPSKVSGSLGLSFRYVKDGVFDRGKSATNRIEAKAVADAVVEHAKRHPTKSLGVGAFSVAQRDAILDEVELRLRGDDELSTFFATGRHEPFFVKNLENIQGDERDVIFISIGYGRNSEGKDSMNFGPVGKQGGERRLNVLITRAKEQCVVFSSIKSTYIDLKRTSARGTAALKTYLQYAELGKIDVPTESDRGVDSEFERQVAKALTGLGLDVRTQIGEAGFFVDLAVVDPEVPGRFLLGIECDGATYHSSRSARDRDQIRQSILEARGWIIHRIWSTDWFQRPDEQIQLVLEAVEAAKIQWGIRDAGDEVDLSFGQDNTIENDEWALSREPAQIELPEQKTIQSIPYEEAVFLRPSEKEIHEVSPELLGIVVENILKVESPIHRNELARRIAQVWDLNRAGSRIVDAVENVIRDLKYSSKIVVSESFISLPSQAFSIRNREMVSSASLKKPEFLPPSEIAYALKQVIQANIGIESEETIREAARLFGFRSTSAKLKGIMKPVLDKVCASNGFKIQQGRIYDAG